MSDPDFFIVTSLLGNVASFRASPDMRKGDRLVRLEDHQARIVELRAQVDGLRADAQRYNAFFEAGLPITFLGQPYYTKADLDEAIDSARAGREDGNGL